MFNEIFASQFNKGDDKNFGTSGAVELSGEMDLSVELESTQITSEFSKLEASMATLNQLDTLLASVELYQGQGLSPDAAAIFVNQAERIRMDMGIGVEVTCSMESFNGGLADNVNALDVSLAGIKDTLSKGWDAVITFLKNLLNRIKTFFTLLGDKMPGLKKRAEALKDKAENTSGSAENSKIKIGNAFAKLADSTTEIKVDTITATLKTLKDLKAPEALVASVSKGKMEALDTSAETLKNATSALIAFNANELSLPNGGLSDNAKPPTSYSVPSGSTTKCTGKLAGMQAFVYTYKAPTDANNLEQALEALASRRFNQRPTEEKLKFDNDREVSTLSPGDVAKICDSIIDFADDFIKSKGTVETARKEAEQMTKLAEKLKTTSAKSDYKDVKGILNKAKSAITSQASIAANPTRDIAAFGYGVAVAAISYGEKSLAQYKD